MTLSARNHIILLKRFLGRYQYMWSKQCVCEISHGSMRGCLDYCVTTGREQLKLHH